MPKDITSMSRPRPQVEHLSPTARRPTHTRRHASAPSHSDREYAHFPGMPSLKNAASQIKDKEVVGATVLPSESVRTIKNEVDEDIVAALAFGDTDSPYRAKSRYEAPGYEASTGTKAHKAQNASDHAEELETKPVKVTEYTPSVDSPAPVSMLQAARTSATSDSPPIASGSQLIPPQDPALEQSSHEPERTRKATGTHASEAGTMQDEGERFRLEHAIRVIDALNARINTMERTEQRLKKQLRDEKERYKDLKADGEGLLNLLVLAEEKVSTAEALTAMLRCDVERYRGWWITEYYSLKAILGMLSRDQRAEARIIGEAAEERYASWLNMRD